MDGRIPDVAWARELLMYVSADCARDEWLRIAMALKAGLGDDGWPVFEEWSRRAPDLFDPAKCRRAWDSLEPDGGVGWGTLQPPQAPAAFTRRCWPLRTWEPWC